MSKSTSIVKFVSFNLIFYNFFDNNFLIFLWKFDLSPKDVELK